VDCIHVVYPGDKSLKERWTAPFLCSPLEGIPPVPIDFIGAKRSALFLPCSTFVNTAGGTRLKRRRICSNLGMSQNTQSHFTYATTKREDPTGLSTRTNMYMDSIIRM
jgi:hypothetical protein